MCFIIGVPIDHCTHVPGPVAQYSAESEYNSSCTAGMSLAYSRVLNIELLNKYPDMVPEQSHLIILDTKSSICMANNFKETKHTRQISRRMHFLINGKECNFHNTVWCEVFIELADIGTKNVSEGEFNTVLGYSVVILTIGRILF